MAGFKDELNNEYGFLKVIEFSHFAYRRNGTRFCPLACWRAECRCGNFVVVRGADLRNGAEIMLLSEERPCSRKYSHQS